MVIPDEHELSRVEVEEQDSELYYQSSVFPIPPSHEAGSDAQAQGSCRDLHIGVQRRIQLSQQRKPEEIPPT